MTTHQWNFGAMRIVMAALLATCISNAAFAGDWEDFFKTYANKRIVVTWDQQTFDKSSAEPPVIHREFSYRMVSPKTMERAGTETDATTQASLDQYAYVITKAEPLMISGGRFRYQTVDIQDSMIINSFYDRGVLFSELRIFVSPTRCTAAFTVDLVEDENVTNRARSLLSCKVETIGKPAAAAKPKTAKPVKSPVKK